MLFRSTIEHSRSHYRAMFGKGVGKVAAVAPTLGAKMVFQVLRFFRCELKHEVVREAVAVPFNCAVQSLVSTP